MRVLVTGATGFVGRHLIDHLIKSGGYEPVGLSRTGRWTDVRFESIPVHAVDLTDAASTLAVLRRVEPEAIVHLAGYAQAGRSFQEPDAAWRSNLTATLGLYSAIEKWGGRPRILFVSSGMVYGASLTTGRSCDESMELLPNSPYAASKAAADLASYQAHSHPGLHIVRIRPFNQIGPGQGRGFAVADFASRIARIEAGLDPPILETGNLDAERDLTDVRDMVRAYQMVLETGASGEVYNAGQGQAIAMRRVVEKLISISGCKIALSAKAEMLRPNEVATTRVNVQKLHAATGWRPKIALDQSLEDVLQDWRGRIPKR